MKKLIDLLMSEEYEEQIKERGVAEFWDKMFAERNKKPKDIMIYNSEDGAYKISIKFEK